MPSLSDRLQALGVKVGTNTLSVPKPRNADLNPIESVLPGKWWSTPNGDVFYVETSYGADFRVGEVGLTTTSSLEIIAEWAREPQLSDLHLEQFAFFDIETTGLSGGSGTYAFLIGVGRFEGDIFRLVQYFLQDPAQETAQLNALESFLSPCKALVSFNGKSFDVPIINSRFITNGFPPPLINTPQLDLLHLARRIWRERLPSRTLGDLEVQILGAKRSENDVPGWMVPDLYFDYLHTGDARPLRGVFYHNEVDVVSLAALLNHLSGLISSPLNQPESYSQDIIAVGKLYADLGRYEIAAEIYEYGLQKGDLLQDSYWDANKRLSMVYKRIGDMTAACRIWERAANHGFLYAHEELAKFYEHRERKYGIAMEWTQNAQKIISKENTHIIKKIGWQESLNHRANRLERKLTRLAR